MVQLLVFFFIYQFFFIYWFVYSYETLSSPTEAPGGGGKVRKKKGKKGMGGKEWEERNRRKGKGGKE